MLFSVIIPTLGRRIPELERLLSSIETQTHKEIEVILVSQDNHDKVEATINKIINDCTSTHIKLKEKGLSFARNSAIPYIKGDVITFSDDDCWYSEDSFERINTFLKENSSLDVECYQIYDPINKEYYKHYQDKRIPKMKLMQLFKRSSIEIFVSLKNISKEELYFNEDFGLGAKYPSGEENILLTALYHKGFKIGYRNEVVVFHSKPTKESRLTLESFRSKGPLFKQIFGSFIGFIMLTALFVKKYKYLEKPTNYYLQAIKEMFGYKRT